MTDEIMYEVEDGELESVSGGVKTYKIQRGDTLTKIANRNNTTVAKIMAVNPELTSASFIVSGLYIYIPQ